MSSTNNDSTVENVNNGEQYYSGSQNTMASPPQSSPMNSGTSASTNAQNSTNSKTASDNPHPMVTKPRLQELVREVDTTEQLDEDVEETLLQMADDFVEGAIKASCAFAKHRKASKVEVKDVQLHLERAWNMWIPGFGTDELRPYKRAAVTEAHKQRLALIRKVIKKY